MLVMDNMGEIKEHAIYMDWNVAFGGKAMGNGHLFRVVTIARFLAEKEKADQDICEAGSWLHDIGLVSGLNDDFTRARGIAESYLSHLPLSIETINRIANCVQVYGNFNQAISLEAQIVHDADILDGMGMLGIIRHTWEIVNLIKPEATSHEISFLVKLLNERRLYTATARKLVAILDESFHQFFAQESKAAEMIGSFIKHAKDGIIPDMTMKELLIKTDNQALLYQIAISDEILQAWYDLGHSNLSDVNLRDAYRHIQFHSCFISYSSKDKHFAQRLYVDLQAKGVRCWFAPEDMKIGDEIRVRIDESIRLHDKLLIILSENSVNSTWVED